MTEIPEFSKRVPEEIVIHFLEYTFLLFNRPRTKNSPPKKNG